MNKSELPQSPDVSRRYKQILSLARLEARRRRRRRRALRGAAACAVIIVAGFSLERLVHPKHIASPVRDLVQLPLPSVALPDKQETPTVVIVEIQTDPTITDRLTISPQEPRWKIIDDDELIRSLAQAGQPAGLATIDGRTMLLPR